MIKDLLRQTKQELIHQSQLLQFRLKNQDKKHFTCPICKYRGPFKDFERPAGKRKHAICPNCKALERHRLQFVVLNQILPDFEPSDKKMLHFAPESFLRKFFSSQFRSYETADIAMKEVDHQVDLQKLPFDDATYDFVFASHVLEHIPDDRRAIQEIRRILKPGGIAVLPVPLICEQTIEYPEPNPHEDYHVRAPGLDYFDRYNPYFSKVEQYGSDRLPQNYQLFIYENRSQWPNEKCPLRPPMAGEKHIGIVPVCYV
ncbi:MAG TPA: class I SAM-dependent methyltransferase [Xenococcaceae cyanobacterium]